MTRNKAKGMKKLEEEIKKIHHLQLLKERKLEEFKEWNALNLEEIIFAH